MAYSHKGTIIKLTLSQPELEQAIRGYVGSVINLQPGTDITIDFKAGRGDNGFTAEVDITTQATQAAAAPVVIKAPEPVVEILTKAKGPSIGDAIAADMERAHPLFKDKPKYPAAVVDAEPEVGEVLNDLALPAKEDAKVTTRKTSGKSLFGSSKDKVDAETTPANDDAAEDVPAAAAGGRKTLFSE